MLDLKHTVKLMNSADYKERFIAEYLQLRERYIRLKNFVNRIRAAQVTGKTEPKHDCPLSVLNAQLNHMDEYLKVLELRAVIEGIDLENEFEYIRDISVGCDVDSSLRSE